MANWDAGRWRTFLWGDTTGLSIIINGVAVESGNLNIDDLLTSEANTASFEIVDTYANKPIEGTQVTVWKDGVKEFDGRVTGVDPEKLSSTMFLFYVECIDHQTDLDKKLVVETYENKTLYYIFNDINTKYLTDFTIDNVENPGLTIARIQFDHQYPSECFQQACDEVGYDWYVDYDRDIHSFPIETNDAPLELIDDGEEFDELKITSDISQIANRILVRGGWYLSDSYDQDPITAVAGQTEFPIRYTPHDFSVEVDAAAKTVGIEFTDAPGAHDFLLNATEKLLKVDNIVMAGAEVVEMAYKFEQPVFALVDDIASQESIAAIQGGDGVIEKYIPDEYIESNDQAAERGRAELLKYANELVEGSFISHYPGWRSGQRLHIKLTDRNIDAYYLIRDVHIESIGGGNLLYTITLATFLQGFNWLLIKFLDGIKPKARRTDDIIHQFSILNEAISVVDSTPTYSLVTPPYQYGPGGSPKGVYNEAQYS